MLVPHLLKTTLFDSCSMRESGQGFCARLTVLTGTTSHYYMSAVTSCCIVPSWRSYRALSKVIIAKVYKGSTKVIRLKYSGITPTNDRSRPVPVIPAEAGIQAAKGDGGLETANRRRTFNLSSERRFEPVSGGGCDKNLYCFPKKPTTRTHDQSELTSRGNGSPSYSNFVSLSSWSKKPGAICPILLGLIKRYCAKDRVFLEVPFIVDTTQFESRTNLHLQF